MEETQRITASDRVHSPNELTITRDLLTKDPARD